MKLENGRIAVELCETCGAVVSLFDKEIGKEYLTKKACIPFEADFGDGFKCEYTAFEVLEATTNTAKLKWTIREGCDLYGNIALIDDGISFTSYVEETELPLLEAKEGEPESIYPYVRLVKYPVVGGFENISADGDSWLYHSWATGMLIKNPAKNFVENNYGMQHMPYPEGFSGCTMQFMSYYSDNDGGLYMASLDGEYYVKWLNFAYPEDADKKPVTDTGLAFSHAYGYQDLDQPGIAAPYPVVIRLMPKKADWYDAADLYKEWAEKQVWCRRGKYSQRKDEDLPLWLLDDTGAATFGISAAYDCTLWLNKYKEYIDTSIFHVSGPDWPNKGQDYMGKGNVGAWNNWFPTKYNPENKNCMHANGDRFAPFEFDLFGRADGDDGENFRHGLMQLPKNRYSVDSYPFRFVCPCDSFIQKFHLDREVEIHRQVGNDAIYYDICANNFFHACVKSEHKDIHGIGGSQKITEGYHKMLNSTRLAVNEDAGKYIPFGTEMVNEVFLDVLDYYQARAWAQPCSTLESWNMRPLIRSGEARLVPAFSYVYHDYGAIRLDGWGKLVYEIGNLFYHTVAKTYLWGGIYEINHEYSPMEVIDGIENSDKDHYCKFNPRGYKFDEERIQYVAKYARLRVDKIAGKYLARGMMLHPIKLEIPYTDYTYYHYNHAKGVIEYNNGGIFSDTALIHSAWHLDGTGDALFFANPTPEDITVSVPVEKDRADGLFADGRSARIYDCGMSGEEIKAFEIPANGEFTLTIPAKACIMIELA